MNKYLETGRAQTATKSGASAGSTDVGHTFVLPPGDHIVFAYFTGTGTTTGTGQWSVQLTINGKVIGSSNITDGQGNDNNNSDFGGTASFIVQNGDEIVARASIFADGGGNQATANCTFEVFAFQKFIT